MPRFVRSALVAGFAATVVTAGVITVEPPAVASAPRSTTASVTLAGAACANNSCLPCSPYCASVVYTPVGEVQLGLVSHPTGLISQLVGTAPPILQAITGTSVTLMAVAPKIVRDVAEFGGYANAAGAVVGQQITTAVRDTFTPAQWGGG
jgi:hypothetical protein